MKKLAICKACEREISKAVNVCPYCGEPSTALKMSRGFLGCGCLMFLAPVIIGIAIFLVVALQELIK